MKKTKKQTVGFFYRRDNLRAISWEKKIRSWLRTHHRSVRIVNRNPSILLVLGGDGTILEAARTYRGRKTLIAGLNLGKVGFLATARKSSQFLPALSSILKNTHTVTERTMVSARVTRRGKNVFSANALNDIVLQNPVGLVEIDVVIEGYPVQRIRGTGALVATSTGSTAYNLSAHGPIVMPDIACLIVTEILDHDIPTPSIVVGSDKRIKLRINDFRKRGLFSTKGGEPLDVILVADGHETFALQKGDVVSVTQSPYSVQFAETKKNYFFKSLEEQFLIQ